MKSIDDLLGDTLEIAVGEGALSCAELEDRLAQALHKALQAVLGDAEVKAGLAALGQEAAAPQSLDAAQKAFADETTQYRAIAKAVNLQPQ